MGKFRFDSVKNLNGLVSSSSLECVWWGVASIFFHTDKRGVCFEARGVGKYFSPPLSLAVRVKWLTTSSLGGVVQRARVQTLSNGSEKNKKEGKAQ